MVEQVQQFGHVELGIESHGDPSPMSHVGRKEELSRTFFDEVRAKFGVARTPQVSEFDVVMTFLPDGDETSLVANEKRRRPVTQTLVHFRQR